jgi:aminoglycoside 3-N-acetyltransferase
MQNNLHKTLIVDLQKGFGKLKINKAKNVYVTSNLTSIAKIRIPKKDKLSIILNVLKNVMGKNYTIFSPSASMNLCNTNLVFDIKKTASYEMGPLAEFVRIQKNSTRSLHPFWSISAIGKNSKILNNISSHAYAYGSPWSKMLDLDTTQLNLGVHPSRAVTLIHHIETICGVPYRFNKKFSCKIMIGNKISKEDFYMSVFFKNRVINKRIKLNEHFFNQMKKLKKLNYHKTSSGLRMWSFKMQDFFKIALKYFVNDIYNYLESKPDLSFHKDL